MTHKNIYFIHFILFGLVIMAEIKVHAFPRNLNLTFRKCGQSPYSKYYEIFTTKFNSGFGNPHSDVCFFCEEEKTKIKTEAISKEDELAYKLHRARVILRNASNKNCLDICFDLQQNQPLLQIAIGGSFLVQSNDSRA